MICYAGTPSALLPSIADLVRSYSTAEDVVSTMSDSHPHANGLSTISETPKAPPESTNSRYIHLVMYYVHVRVCFHNIFMSNILL